MILQDKRERLFWGVTDLNAFMFAGMITLKQLSVKPNQYGRQIQSGIRNTCQDVWTPGNDLLYTILNTYEEEGYVKSYWNSDEDKSKKYMRIYQILPRGYQYYMEKSPELLHEIKTMKKICLICLNYVFGNVGKNNYSSYNNKEIMSASLFTALNSLYYISTNYQCVYAKEIQSHLESTYQGLWKPNDGNLYPALSDMEIAGYVTSIWDDKSKKRTIRRYKISEKGKQHLFFLLSQDSGVKTKLEDMIRMCDGVICYLT